MSIKRFNIIFIEVTLCLFILMTSVSAADFQQVDLDESEFLLLDFHLEKKRLIAAAESYQYQEQTLIPAGLFLSSLGTGVQTDADQSSIIYSNDGKTITLDLTQNKSSMEFSAEHERYYWATDGFEIYLSQLLLAQLIGGEIKVDLSKLLLEIRSGTSLLPIEKQWRREDKVLHENAKSKKTEALYVPDQYQFLTQPNANIGLTLGGQDAGNGSEFSAGYSVQSNFDFLYHSTTLSLFHDIKNQEFSSRVNFSRYQPSPDETMLLGLRRYSFGDISTSSNSLLNRVPGGLGIEMSRRYDGYNRDYGAQNIEGDAIPGWQVELYINGYFLDQLIVPENGHYIFKNVELEYGSNPFELRLFGPHGEEEVKRNSIVIGQNMLQKGEIGYDVYYIDRNKTVLDSNKSDSDSSFGTDYGFAFDYSLAKNIQLGTFFQHSQDRVDDEQKYTGLHIESSFVNMQMDLEAVHQLDQGQRVTLQGSGRLSSEQTYNFNFQDKDNFSVMGSPNDTHYYQGSASISGYTTWSRGLRYSGAVNYTGSDLGDSAWLFSPRLSWRFPYLNTTNTFNYLVTKGVDKDRLGGELNLNSQLGSIRLNSATNYRLVPDAEFVRTALTTTWQQESGTNHNLLVSYLPENSLRADSSWRAQYLFGISFNYLNLNIGGNYDSEEHWGANLGISFSLDYDSHNRSLLITNQGLSSTGSLNVQTYLDRNNNGRKDEADWDLSGVEFSPLNTWQEHTTTEQGTVSLSGVPSQRAFTLSANWQEGAETKAEDYTVFTHSGGRVDIEIPFEIKTNISGIALINSNKGERPLTVSTIILTDLDKGKEYKEVLDIDGFFEFNNISPSHYSLQISEKDLSRLGLVAQQGMLKFVTPRQGGYYEIEPIYLQKAKDVVSEQPSETLLILDDSNGEPFYFGDKAENNQIYSELTNNEHHFGRKSKRLPASNEPIISFALEPVLAPVLDNSESQFEQKTNISIMIKVPAETPVYQVQLLGYETKEDAAAWLKQYPRYQAECKIVPNGDEFSLVCGVFIRENLADDYAETMEQVYPDLDTEVISVKEVDSLRLQKAREKARL